MKILPTNDPLFGKGPLRADGRRLIPAYLFEVKKPEESEISVGPVQNEIATISPEDARKTARSQRVAAGEEVTAVTTAVRSSKGDALRRHHLRIREREDRGHASPLPTLLARILVSRPPTSAPQSEAPAVAAPTPAETARPAAEQTPPAPMKMSQMSV